MSTSNNIGADNSTIPPLQQQQQPTFGHGRFIVVLPPPPTVWVQFNDGMQMGFTPSPTQYLQSVLNGVSIFGSASGGNANGNATTSNDNNNGFINALNELFERAQEQHYGPPPTSKVFLDKLPMKVWTQDMEKTEKQTECVICLSEYENDDKIISLPCGHTFHKDCGMTWLVAHNVCPTCRYQLPRQVETVAAHATAQTVATATVDREPTLEDTALNVTGVRRQRSTDTLHSRDVRQRVNEPTLALVDEDAEMDLMLEQEAERFVREELAQRQSVSNDDGVVIRDSDVEKVLHETLIS